MVSQNGVLQLSGVLHCHEFAEQEQVLHQPIPQPGEVDVTDIPQHEPCHLQPTIQVRLSIKTHHYGAVGSGGLSLQKCPEGPSKPGYPKQGQDV